MKTKISSINILHLYSNIRSNDISSLCNPRVHIDLKSIQFHAFIKNYYFWVIVRLFSILHFCKKTHVVAIFRISSAWNKLFYRFIYNFKKFNIFSKLSLESENLKFDEVKHNLSYVFYITTQFYIRMFQNTL